MFFNQRKFKKKLDSYHSVALQFLKLYLLTSGKHRPKKDIYFSGYLSGVNNRCAFLAGIKKGNKKQHNLFELAGAEFLCNLLDLKSIKEAENYFPDPPKNDKEVELLHTAMNDGAIWIEDLITSEKPNPSGEPTKLLNYLNSNDY